MAKAPLTPQKAQRAKLVKVLSLCAIVTLLGSVALSFLTGVTNNFSAVLDEESVALIQLDEPGEDAVQAVMHTDAGDMTFTLYPDEAPQTVAGFIQNAEEGLYDGSYVFRVEPDVFFSAGAQDTEGTVKDPEGDRERIPQELSPKLWPLRGALCALTSHVDGGFWKRFTKSETYYTGSRFLVCDTIEMTDEIRSELTAGEGVMQTVGKAFAEQGGIPNYSQQITVFGQLTEGFEVLDAITSAAVTGGENAKRPAQDIRISSVEILRGK